MDSLFILVHKNGHMGFWFEITNLAHIPFTRSTQQLGEANIIKIILIEFINNTMHQILGGISQG